jgi:hypothetical protein
MRRTLKSKIQELITRYEQEISDESSRRYYIDEQEYNESQAKIRQLEYVVDDLKDLIKDYV